MPINGGHSSKGPVLTLVHATLQVHRTSPYSSFGNIPSVNVRRVISIIMYIIPYICTIDPVSTTQLQ